MGTYGLTSNGSSLKFENKNSYLNEKNEELINWFEETKQTKESLQLEIENKEGEIKPLKENISELEN
jgi:SMC interacting uncharacterized protein involved in chromosome segregation